MRINILLAALVLAASAAAAPAADSLAIAIAKANPAVQSRAASLRADMADGRQENVLEGPEADFDYKFGSESEDNRWGLSIGQTFDWPGVYTARRRALAAKESAFELLYRQELAEAFYQAKTAIIDFNSAREAADELDLAAANARRLLAVYRNALQRGETTLLEVNKLQLQVVTIEGRAAMASADVSTAAVRLNSLAPEMQLPAEIPATDIEPFDAAECRRASQLPLDLARKMSAVAKLDADAAGKSYLPKIKLAYVHDYEEGRHFNGFSIGLSLPSWSRSNATAAARERIAAAEADSRRTEADTEAEFHKNLLDIAALQARYDAAAPLFEGDAYTSTLTKALDAGKLSIFDYLREYNDYLDAKVEFIGLKAELARNIADIKRYLFQ